MALSLSPWVATPTRSLSPVPSTRVVSVTRNLRRIQAQSYIHFSLQNLGLMHDKRGQCKQRAFQNKDESTNTIQGDQDIQQLKKVVIQAVANTNRGKDTTADQKQNILRLIEALEACNPTTSPVDSPLLSGLWSLLYTAPVYEEKVDKYAGAEEGPFLARLKPLSFGSIRQTASFQVIDTGNSIVQNIAEFIFLGIKGSLVIEGKAVKSSTFEKESVRIEVTFESFFLRIGKWQSPKIPLDWVNPKGWVDTTFLDQDLRVGRGDKGSIFVSARVKKQ